MTLHIQKFVDRVRGAEARGSRDFTMSMTDAKNLHADITQLLLDLHNAKELAQSKFKEDSVITVEVNGGTF